MKRVLLFRVVATYQRLSLRLNSALVVEKSSISAKFNFCKHINISAHMASGAHEHTHKLTQTCAICCYSGAV